MEQGCLPFLHPAGRFHAAVEAEACPRYCRNGKIKLVAPSTAAIQRLELGKALSKMVYGTVCFATLFSFVGTVLGGSGQTSPGAGFGVGIRKKTGTADRALERDRPHVRWGGLARDRGIMNLCVLAIS
jgi:hypothetical protein